MKKKMVKKSGLKTKNLKLKSCCAAGQHGPGWKFGSAEFLLLVCIVVALLVLLGWQTGTLPGFLTR